MEIIRDLDKFRCSNPVVTIGNFDGVHIGHQKIFKRVVEKAREINGTPVAITFDPHPVRVLTPERGMKMITTFQDKSKLIFSTGIEVLICINFDREFSHINPEDFIRDVLVNKLKISWVIVGHNYAFGKGKKGTPVLLRRRGKKYGFNVSVVRYARVYDDIVSSSRIRSLILRGRVCEASKMLGRAYHIGGKVIKGAGRGASILHVPTANISPVNELIPKEGVYAVRISVQETGEKRQIAENKIQKKSLTSEPCDLISEIYDGVANIGKNPTFGDVPMSYEVHIFDFNKDLFNREIRIHFIDRIRDEKKFPGISELYEQIKKDIQEARQILSMRNDPLFLM